MKWNRNPYAAVRDLSQESAIIAEGVVREDKRTSGVPGGCEIGDNRIPDHPMCKNLPITPKAHGAMNPFFATVGGTQNPGAHHPGHAELAGSSRFLKICKNERKYSTIIS